MGDFKVVNVVGELEFGCVSAAKKFKNMLEDNNYHDILDIVKVCMIVNVEQNCSYDLHVYSSAHNNITGIVESTDDCTVFWLTGG
jgi:hypothetical protein